MRERKNLGGERSCDDGGRGREGLEGSAAANPRRRRPACRPPQEDLQQRRSDSAQPEPEGAPPAGRRTDERRVNRLRWWTCGPASGLERDEPCGGWGCLLHVARSRYRPPQAELGFRLGVCGGAVQMRRAVGAGWGEEGGGHDWMARAAGWHRQ